MYVRDKPVSNHYKNKRHTRTTPETYILEHLTGDPEKCQQKRRQKERNWIYNLKLFTPYGLNTMGKYGRMFLITELSNKVTHCDSVL